MIIYIFIFCIPPWVVNALLVYVRLGNSSTALERSNQGDDRPLLGLSEVIGI